MKTISNNHENCDDLLVNVRLRTFIDFLKKEGYDIRMRHPKHVPGQGYSPPPFYSNVDTDYAVADFLRQYGTANIDGTFTENKVDLPKIKAEEFKNKYKYLAKDVVNDILDTIKHEDNVMYYEIKFWTEVKELL